MQKPTLQNVRIRSTRDALLVFTGVANNRLPLITRRLDAEERRSIVSGNVYVWEERGANNEPTGLGMERWTDGMGWGPSRVRDEFLFYHQKESNVGEDLVSPITPWAQMMRKREEFGPRASTSRSAEFERLTKQTYSVHVSLPGDVPRGITRKWHLTAYFSQQRLETLDTVDKIPSIGDATVPEGWFRSARSGKRRDHRRLSCSQMTPDAVPGPHTDSLHALYFPNTRQQIPPTFMQTSPQPSDPRDLSPSPDYTLEHLNGAPNIKGRLVPLEYLQNVSGSRRDPVDEQVLKRFSPLRQGMITAGR